MVLCLVTLTDLQTRRAGSSASAELLVCTCSTGVQQTTWSRMDDCNTARAVSTCRMKHCVVSILC